MKLPDQAARDAIRTRLDRNLIVEAPAGSGKTHSLSSRMVAGLRTGLFLVQDMAAVTFTRKAASELRGRLQLALEEAHRLEPSPNLAAALRDLDRMFLGTVHSFCGRLVREYPVEAGISPGFRETDDAEDTALRVHFFRRCLEHPEGVRAARELGESGSRPADLLEALRIVCDNGEVRFEAPAMDRPDPAPVWDAALKLASDLEPLMPREVPREVTCKVLERCDQFLRKLRYAERSQFNLLTLLRFWESELKFVFKWWPGGKLDEKRAHTEEVRALLEPFRQSVALRFLTDWRAYLYGVSLALLNRVREVYASERRRRGLLNFNDLLTTAAALLRENGEVREKLQNRFRWLFVDEFQDTDPIQAEVLFYLAARAGQKAGDWSQLELRPGALFIVGDPKQSIYRFRRADIETYNLVRERMDEVIALSTSFRSRPGLCQWTNEVFGQLLPAEPTHEQAAFSPLEPVEEGPASVWRNVETCQRYTEAAACEAERIAAWIDGSAYKPGDFMLLTWKREHLGLYAQALAARGIPHEVTGGHAREEELVDALLELLAVLGDPQDEVSVVGVLRGPLFGLDDDTLFRHRHAGGSFFLGSETGETEVCRALAALQDYRELVRRLPMGAAVERVLEKTGLVALAASRGGGTSELLQVADQVRLLSQDGVTLSEALRTLTLARLEQPLALDCGRSDVVRLMNLHQAKGLEARVVFLASPTGGFPVRVDQRIVRDEGGARGYLSIQGQVQVFARPADWDAHEQAERGYLEAERIRLLYVAATRAREVLVVGQWSGTDGRAQRPWLPFDRFLSEDLPHLDQEVGPATPEESLELPDWEAAREASRQPTWSRTSVTARNDGQKLEVWSVPVPEQVLQSERQDSGAEWGELIHRLLEHQVRRPELGRDELERLARWFTFEVPELAELIPLALDTVETVKASEFWTRAMQAGRRLVEVPFGRKVADRLLFGVIDVALEGEEGWEIIDYKTDRKSLEELVERYAGQVASYAEAWSCLAAEPVAYAGLYGVREARLSDHLGDTGSSVQGNI